MLWCPCDHQSGWLIAECDLRPIQEGPKLLSRSEEAEVLWSVLAPAKDLLRFCGHLCYPLWNEMKNTLLIPEGKFNYTGEWSALTGTGRDWTRSGGLIYPRLPIGLEEVGGRRLLANMTSIMDNTSHLLHQTVELWAAQSLAGWWCRVLQQIFYSHCCKTVQLNSLVVLLFFSLTIFFYLYLFFLY